MRYQFAILALQVGLRDNEIDEAWAHMSAFVESMTPGEIIRALESFKRH
jgi:hypothetical protein